MRQINGKFLVDGLYSTLFTAASLGPSFFFLFARFIIVMELTPHGSLFDLMKTKHVLNESEAADYFLQLISALDFCHSKFIAHRDLKLENLLVFWENRLKISDFGFSRYVNTTDQSTIFSRTYCGSDAYICPEILHQKPYNPIKSDIWACGVILFAMVFGRLPFDDTGSIQKLVEVSKLYGSLIKTLVEKFFDLLFSDC